MALVFSNLNKRRYAQHDDTLYVAPEDERTDYVCLSLSLSSPSAKCNGFLVPTTHG